MTGFLRDFLASWDRYWIELHDLQELAPGRFLASATQYGRGRTAALRRACRPLSRSGSAGREIAQLEFFYDHARAVAALGRTE